MSLGTEAMGVCWSFRNVHGTLYKGQDRERVKVNITIIILRASWGLLHLEGQEELVAGSTLCERNNASRAEILWDGI